MAKSRAKGPKQHKFRHKLILNQWLISLFGIDVFKEHKVSGKKELPFHKLAEPIKDQRIEGFDSDNLHRFYHELVRSDMFWNDFKKIDKEQLLGYEKNIVRHTQQINEKRHRHVQ